jgi:hypothetical protein
MKVPAVVKLVVVIAALAVAALTIMAAIAHCTGLENTNPGFMPAPGKTTLIQQSELHASADPRSRPPNCTLLV